MGKWMKERDLLIEETLTFVQRVVAAKPVRIETSTPIIPTAADFDSFWDSQIRETLTRCLLLREEQDRWVERLGSHGVI